MVYDRETAARRAEAATTNVPDTCQLVTRQWFGAPSVGDHDGDGAADAEDGWKSEPAQFRHTDRHPPRGVPVSYLGGSRDHGHRAISLGNGLIRSTDAAGRGRVGTVPLDWPEKQWGLRYVGWSETIDGYPIPDPPAPLAKPEAKKVRRPEVVAALNALRKVRATAKTALGRKKAQDRIDDVKRDFPGSQR